MVLWSCGSFAVRRAGDVAIELADARCASRRYDRDCEAETDQGDADELKRDNFEHGTLPHHTMSGPRCLCCNRGHRITTSISRGQLNERDRFAWRVGLGRTA